MPVRFLCFVLLLGITGCSASEKQNSVVSDENPLVMPPGSVVASAEDSSSIILVGLKEDSPPQQIQTTETLSIDEAFLINENASTSLSDSHSERIYLESLAADQNPKLIRLYREYQAAASRSHYVDKLPDPKLGANIFGNPIETASGSQQANMSLSQTIPWLSRLNAEQQRACFEAMAIRAEYAAERLRVIAAVQTQWARLYLIEQQIEITQANQSLLKSLIDVANSRVSIGKASQGDVLLGTVEYSKLEEQLLVFRQQKQSVVSELNRLTGRPAGTPIKPPAKLEILKPEWSLLEITQIALNEQPEIQAAHLRTQATEWGIEVARLMRRPEFMISASYFITDDNRPPSPFVNVGEDPWALGAQVSIPIWRDKYDAIKNEAGWKHQAAHNSVQELLDRYDALLLDLVTESHRAAETANLYKSSILPQAEQTLAADQDAYINGVVEFDRVIRDYRNLFTLELGYHKAISDLTIANAKIQQAAGVPVPLKHAAK